MPGENVTKKLNIEGIPDELIYSLWSTSVGASSLGRSSAHGNPLFIRDAHVHLPDFTNEKVKEILVYALLCAFVRPDYTDGMIGFVGARKLMRFGKSSRLNKGARFLFDNYGDLPVGEQTISEVILDIKNGEIKERVRINIANEIDKRLIEIGYWDHIPLPQHQRNHTLPLEFNQ